MNSSVAKSCSLTLYNWILRSRLNIRQSKSCRLSTYRNGNSAKKWDIKKQTKPKTETPFPKWNITWQSSQNLEQACVRKSIHKLANSHASIYVTTRWAKSTYQNFVLQQITQNTASWALTTSKKNPVIFFSSHQPRGTLAKTLPI